MRRRIEELQEELEAISKDISNHWNDNPLERLIDVTGEMFEWSQDFIGEPSTERNIENCKYELKKR